MTGAAALAGFSLLLTGCANGSEGAANAEGGTEAEEGRIAVSYDGGIAVLDGETLEVIEQFDTEQFTRLNAFGDGQHVVVTTSKGFQVLDTAAPELTDVVIEATAGGHVVRHDGKTVLFDDGTGTTTMLDTKALLESDGELPEVETHTADSPHHGVSIVLEDGTLVTTVGTEESRTGAVALHPHDDHWHEAASSDECPGIHGEGTAAEEAVIFGCENGALLFKDGEFTKFTAPDEYGRMGNAFVSETSPIVVGDYTSDPDAEGYLLNAVTLIDTAAGTYDVVDLPDEVQYTFRDVVRGPDDNAYILSSDGSIHVLDPASGEIIDAFPVVETWEGPSDWQDAHPAIVTDGEVAYVTEPGSNAIHVVDLATGDVQTSAEFDFTPNEIAVAAV
ncbi:zinc metallochaperone AztD [Paramicrobacterium chengjingii]|nr:zinc metallochaperone AztD [Microbacterium chengjingii]